MPLTDDALERLLEKDHYSYRWDDVAAVRSLVEEVKRLRQQTTCDHVYGLEVPLRCRTCGYVVVRAEARDAS